MKLTHAIFENGVFRPTEHVELPEHSTVEFEPRLIGDNGQRSQAHGRVYAVLSERYASGQSDVSARHDDLEP